MKWKIICSRICDVSFWVIAFFAAFSCQIVILTRYLTYSHAELYKGLRIGIVQGYLSNVIVLCLLYGTYRLVMRRINPSHKKIIWVIRVIGYLMIAFTMPWLINYGWIMIVLDVILLAALLILPHRELILFGAMLFATVGNLWIVGVITIGSLNSVRSFLCAVASLMGPLLFILLVICSFFYHSQPVRLICLLVLATELCVNLSLVFMLEEPKQRYIWNSALLVVPIVTCLAGWLLRRKDQSPAEA